MLTGLGRRRYNAAMTLHDYNHLVLKEWRDERSLSVREVAEYLNVSRMTVYRVEKGHVASYRLLKRMAALYARSVTDVLRTA